MTSTLPPAATIFASADLLNLCACTTIAFLTFPFPRILIGSDLRLIKPTSTSACGVMVPEKMMSEAFQVDNRVLLAKDVRKAMFGHSTDQRHLTPFKPTCLPTPTTGSGQESLVALSRCFPMARAWPTTDPLTPLSRALCRAEIM